MSARWVGIAVQDRESRIRSRAREGAAEEAGVHGMRDSMHDSDQWGARTAGRVHSGGIGVRTRRDDQGDELDDQLRLLDE